MNQVNPYASAALEASHVVTASKGRLHTCAAYNNNAAKRYLQCHDSARLPAEGAVPFLTVAVPPDATGSFDYGVFGYPVVNGLVVLFSTTAATKTISGNDALFSVTFV